MERVALARAEIRIAGRGVPSETLFAYAGAFQLTLSTTLPDQGVQLHSAYLGHPRAEHTSASHLLIAAIGLPRLWTEEHSPGELPVAHARRLCLLDHLAVLVERLRESTGVEILLDVPSGALVQLDHA
ncbi:MAG: hypothetical protein ACR2LV_02555 [Solirubrobacteraceae bacterium]